MKNKEFLSIMVFSAMILLFLNGCQAAKEEPVAEAGEEFADTGAILVESSPRLAQVYIGEEYRGDTPLTLYNIPVGQHRITLKKQGYSNFEKSVAIKVGMTEEIDALLKPLAPAGSAMEEKKAIGDTPTAEKVPENLPAAVPKSNKISLTSFAMYYDFGKMQFTEIRTEKSDLFSRKYDVYVHFISFPPAKIEVIKKPLKDVTKEDCIFSEAGVAQLFSGQTLCVKTIDGPVVALGGSWEGMPSELEWVQFN